MIPPSPFSAISLEQGQVQNKPRKGPVLDYHETAEFLSEIKERHALRPSALLKEVVG